MRCLSLRTSEIQVWLYQKIKIPCKYRKKCVQFKNTKECDMVGYMFDYISSKQMISLRRSKKYCWKYDNTIYSIVIMNLFFVVVYHLSMYWLCRGGRVIKDILCTGCYSGSLFSKARLKRQSLFPFEIPCFSFLIFRMCFTLWVLRGFVLAPKVVFNI